MRWMKSILIDIVALILAVLILVGFAWTISSAENARLVDSVLSRQVFVLTLPVWAWGLIIIVGVWLVFKPRKRNRK